jgi:Tol biopolymer transport system component
MRWHIAIFAALSLVACGDDSNAPAPIAGSVEVTATTTGTSLDPDGYTVVLDPQGPGTQSQSLAANGGTASFSDVAPGQHTVELQGFAGNCVVSPRTSQPVSVAAGKTSSVAFSVVCSGGPSGSRIAFASDRDGENEVTEIYVMNADGSNVVRLTNHPATDTRPAWSPDGSKIAFVSNRAGNSGIFVMDTDGSNVAQLTNDLDDSPAWSPDGSRIAFTRFVDPEAIFIMNADGSSITRLTDELGYDPAWSPDGSQIAFAGFGGTYVMNVDGSNIRLLASSGFTPAWSPDGSRIAFEGISSVGDPGLFVMNADGSNVIQLTSDRDNAPTWSPDGAKIAFDRESEPFGEPDIYVMNADGSGITRLTNDPSEDEDPAWSP